MSNLFNQITRSLRVLVILGVILSLLVACGPEPTEAPPEATTAPPESTATPTAKPTPPPEPTATPTTEPTPTPEPTATPEEEVELEFVTYEHPSGAFSVDIPEGNEYHEMEDGVAFTDGESLIMVIFGDVETSLASTSVETIAQSILDDTLIGQGLISSYEGIQTESEGDTFLVSFDYTSDALDDGEGGFVLSQLGQTLYALVLLTPDYDSVEEIFLTAFESFEATPVEATAPPSPPTDTPTPPSPLTTAPVASPAEEHFEKGFEYFQQEKWDEAIAEFQEAIRLDPELGEAYLGLGYSHVSKGEFEQAIADLEKYLQLEPGADNRAQVESDIQQMRDILAQPPSTGPCCQPLQPGKGQIWFINYIAEAVRADIGPNFYEIPAKQGDVDGCLCPQLDPGHYMAIVQTDKGELRVEIDIVAGQTLQFPLRY